MSDDYQLRKDIDRIIIDLYNIRSDGEKVLDVYTREECEERFVDNGEIGSYPLKTELVDLIYPIGSIYMSVLDVNPSLLFGGLWEKIEGKFLLASSNNYQLGSTGGEATHTLTIDEIPSHNHSLANNGQTLSINGNTSETTSGFTSGNLWNNMQKATTTIANTGGGEAHNNMPPYLAVNIWKRVPELLEDEDDN